jgi:predicted nucleic acid-binding protein
LGKNHKIVLNLFLNSNIVISTIVSLKVKFKTSRSILNYLKFDLNPKTIFLNGKKLG